jgi:hypothetical protein
VLTLKEVYFKENLDPRTDKIRYEVAYKGPWELRVVVYEGEELVGEINMFSENVSRNEMHDKSECQTNARTLHNKVFGQGRINLWVVGAAHIAPRRLRNKGIGKELYERAFKELAPAIVAPDTCMSGTTSRAAARVWSSLKHKYPSMGSAASLVLAVI